VVPSNGFDVDGRSYSIARSRPSSIEAQMKPPQLIILSSSSSKPLSSELKNCYSSLQSAAEAYVRKKFKAVMQVSNELIATSFDSSHLLVALL